MKCIEASVVLVAAAAATAPISSVAQVNQQVIPQTRTIKNTRIELGEEKPGIIKIGETRAVKIGESRAIKLGEPPSDRFKKIGVDVDLRAMHEAAFGPIGQNDWITNSVAAGTNSAAGAAGSTNGVPAGSSAAAARTANKGPAASAPLCMATGLPCSKLCPGH